MTVAIGLVCKDGVLVASDSMGSDANTASRVRKVFTLDRSPIAWTASGSVFVIEEVATVLGDVDVHTDPAIQAAITMPDTRKIRDILRQVIPGTMGNCYRSALSSTPLPAGAISANFAASFLVLGYANRQPWFLEFAADGQINWHTDDRFYATGSGGEFATVAHALMGHYLTAPVDLEHGKLIAYRAIATTCEVSNAHVGLPVQMAIVDAEGCRTIDEKEIRSISDMVDRWKTLEADTLRMTAEDAKATALHDLPSMGDGTDILPDIEPPTPDPVQV